MVLGYSQPNSLLKLPLKRVTSELLGFTEGTKRGFKKQRKPSLRLDMETSSK